MTSSIAADRRKGASALLCVLTHPHRRTNAANDNVTSSPGATMLSAALRHFAKHGIAAAEKARDNAEEAFFAGDRESYQWWLGICRTLDRRMAAACAANTI